MPGKTQPAAAADRKFERRSDVRAAHVQHACRPHASGPPAPHKLATVSPRAEVLGHAATVTLYKEQWLKLLDMSDDIRAFIAANEAQLKTKNQNK